MKKVIVFILVLIFSYTLVQWGSGLVLTFMYDSDPSTFVKEDSTSPLLHLMPIIFLVFPLVMAYYITVRIYR